MGLSFPQICTDGFTPDFVAAHLAEHAEREAVGFFSGASWRHVQYVPPASVQKLHSVRVGVGGNCVELNVPNLTRGKMSRGDRKRSNGFSASSRLNLLRFVNGLDRDALQPGQVWFATLTYPQPWPGGPHEWKEHLRVLERRLSRLFKESPRFVWKLEPQQRGAPHFHLLMVLPERWARGAKQSHTAQRHGRTITKWTANRLPTFRRWLSKAWFEIVGSGDEKHLRAGTQVEPMGCWERVSEYAGKEVGKLSRGSFGVCLAGGAGIMVVEHVGRHWGIYGRAAFPRRRAVAALSPAAFAACRRVLRKYRERVKGGARLRSDETWSSQTLFVPGAVGIAAVNWAAKLKGGSAEIDPWNVYDLRSYCNELEMSGNDELRLVGRKMRERLIGEVACGHCLEPPN